MTFKDYIKQDLDIFFNLEELGENIIHNNISLPVIFLEKSDYVSNDGYIDTTPSILLKREFSEDIFVGDVIYFRDIKYFVLKKEFKDEFITKIYISKDNRNF